MFVKMRFIFNSCQCLKSKNSEPSATLSSIMWRDEVLGFEMYMSMMQMINVTNHITEHTIIRLKDIETSFVFLQIKTNQSNWKYSQPFC